MNNGWVSLHRRIIKWEWYDDANTFRLFVHCLLLANHEKKNWRGAIIERGQFISSQSHMALDLGLSVQNIRTSLNKLKSTGELTVKITNKYSIISITNYESYQDANRLSNTESTTNQQSTNSQLTVNQQQTITKTTKSLNNDNKREPRKRFASPSLIEIQEYIDEKNYIVNADTFFNFYESNGWKVGKNPMKSWKASLATWNSKEAKPKPLTEKERFYAEMRGDINQPIEGECHVIK